MRLEYIILIVGIVFLLLIMLGLAIANFSGDELFDNYKKFSQRTVPITPIELVETLNNLIFGGKISIKQTEQKLADSFGGNWTLTLCSEYANEFNFAGVVICAHELGHAEQYLEFPQKMKKFMALKKLSTLLSKLTIPMFVVGLAFLIINKPIICACLVAIGIFCFLLALIAKAKTVQIEKDASVRALKILKDYGGFSDEQINYAKQFLNSAKLTYVAEILRSMLKWTFLIRK